MPKRMLHRLPVEAYTELDWFEREQEAIFSPHVVLRRIRRGCV